MGETENGNIHSQPDKKPSKISWRTLPGYTPLKNLIVGGTDFIGRLHTTPVTTIEQDYPEISQVDKKVSAKCAEVYEMDDLAIQGMHDAVIREVFNSREQNRFGIKELNFSKLKAKATNVLMAKDPHTSVGLGNVKAFRLTKNIYDALPTDLQSQIAFDSERGHVEPVSLARFLNSGNTAADYANTLMLYGAVYKANKNTIDLLSEEHQYTDWQKRYVMSVIMCCSDPLTENSTPENVAYDNGFMLLHNQEFAQNHFKVSEDAIKKRQHLSDSFFT